MKILLNGDSNMSGEELEDKSLSIGSQLCRLLGGQEINLALTGASNDRIYDTTLEYVKNNPDIDLVVVGWSEVSRVQWFLTNQGRPEFVEVNNLGVGRWKYPSQYNHRLEHWHKSGTNLEYRTGLSHYWHERIYNLHKYLEYYHIPHVFFNAFHEFMIHDSQYQLDWHNRFVGPYDPTDTYVDYCQGNNYKEITPGWYHFEPAGQLAWATRLFDHVQKHNLMNKP
jgi:hypothetical protein